jgi:hypothetical protein
VNINGIRQRKKHEETNNKGNMQRGENLSLLKILILSFFIIIYKFPQILGAYMNDVGYKLHQTGSGLICCNLPQPKLNVKYNQTRRPMNGIRLVLNVQEWDFIRNVQKAHYVLWCMGNEQFSYTLHIWTYTSFRTGSYVMQKVPFPIFFLWVLTNQCRNGLFFKWDTVGLMSYVNIIYIYI